MEYELIQSITYYPQEYLEVILKQAIDSKNHAYYLSVDHLLNCFIHVSTSSIIYFDTQYFMTLKHYLTHHPITKMELKEWCLFLLDQFEFEMDGLILWDIEYIFMNEKSKQLILCKVPQIHLQISVQYFCDLLMQIYEVMNFEGDDEWASQLYLILKSKPFKLNLFRQFLMAKKNKRWISFFKKENDDLDDFFQMLQVQESEIAYGITTVPFETQILMAGYDYGYLVDEKQNKCLISSSPWLIGRKKDCHYVLDFPEISKNHCQIILENGVCFLEDQKSTNGTTLNGERLVPNSKYPLKNEDVISLAGHNFIYYV